MISNGRSTKLGRALERSSANEEDLDDHDSRLTRIERQQWAQSAVLLLLLAESLGGGVSSLREALTTILLAAL